MLASLPDPRRWWALLLLSTAQFIVILDTSIIGVALPAIQTDLHFSTANLQWIFNAYVAIFGGLLLLGGRMADLFGQRRIFMTGFAILTLASLAAGLAWSDTALIVARGFQGLGAALIAPAALTIVMNLFTNPAELTRAMGFWGASAAVGGSAGVFLGGVLTQWLSWRWVFLINVPLGGIVLAFSLALLRPGVLRRGSLDILGALAVTAASVLAVYAIVTAEQNGWGSLSTMGLLAVATVLLIIFVIIQRVRKEPLVPLQIFRAPNLSAANIIMALLAAAWIPLWFFLNLYLQQVLGLSALEGGLALLPMTLAIMVLMVGMTARMVGRFGFKPNLVAGFLLLAAALVLLANAPANGSFVVNVLPASLLAALGMALTYIPATIAGMSGAKPEETGLASGLINSSYQIGSAIGLAVMTVLANGQTDKLLAGGTGRALALNSGFQLAFVGAAVAAGIGALLALAFLRQPAPAQPQASNSDRAGSDPESETEALPRAS
ncbi:MAG: MFS transporter [Chloroflexi bacterium]|nr:MFS transporter [Chloroflexota bacterium]OJV99065.1 MAG: MFS transporter [Chloroflexi bacterium 54-19]